MCCSGENKIIERLDKIIELLTPKPVTIGYSSSGGLTTDGNLVVKGTITSSAGRVNHILTDPKYADIVKAWRETTAQIDRIQRFMDRHNGDDPDGEPARV